LVGPGNPNNIINYVLEETENLDAIDSITRIRLVEKYIHLMKKPYKNR